MAFQLIRIKNSVESDLGTFATYVKTYRAFEEDKPQNINPDAITTTIDDSETIIDIELDNHYYKVIYK